MAVLSIDLACKAWDRIGIVLLESRAGQVIAEPLRAHHEEKSMPAPASVARFFAALGDDHAVTCLMIDGPQAMTGGSILWRRLDQVQAGALKARTAR